MRRFEGLGNEFLLSLTELVPADLDLASIGVAFRRPYGNESRVRQAGYRYLNRCMGAYFFLRLLSTACQMTEFSSPPMRMANPETYSQISSTMTAPSDP